MAATGDGSRSSGAAAGIRSGPGLTLGGLEHASPGNCSFPSSGRAFFRWGAFPLSGPGVSAFLLLGPGLLALLLPGPGERGRVQLSGVYPFRGLLSFHFLLQSFDSLCLSLLI